MDSKLTTHINPVDTAELRRSFHGAQPFPFVVIDDFLKPALALEIMQSYPSYPEACRLGRSFEAVNERGKVQVTDASSFSAPLRRLNDLLQLPSFGKWLTEITAIENLRSDAELTGGGMHLMRRGSHLDVHTDFNRLPTRGWYRRLNVLIYLNDPWPEDWGGPLEIWDRDVRHCHQRIAPRLNRCIVFATSRASFHGVGAVHCPDGMTRKSFSTYYYTAERPEDQDGKVRDTVFRARPTERYKAYVLMPAERALRTAKATAYRVKARLRRRGSLGTES